MMAHFAIRGLMHEAALTADEDPDRISYNYGARLAQRQSEQISRLTLVSLIFLPITFLTGFFGMNFSWMISVLGSAAAFVALGILLPALSVVLTVLWLKRRRLL